MINSFIKEIREYKDSLNILISDIEDFMVEYEELGHDEDFSIIKNDLFDAPLSNMINIMNYVDMSFSEYDNLREYLIHVKSTKESFSHYPEFNSQVDLYLDSPKIKHDSYTETQSLMYHRDVTHNKHEITMHNLQALMAYQGGPHDKMNMFLLFNGDNITEENSNNTLVEHVKSIDSAFLTGGIKSDRTEIFYRGIGKEEYQGILDAYDMDGGIYNHKSFISTSDSILTAKNFGRMVEIHIPPESDISYISMNDVLWDSAFQGEREYLLPRDLEFELTFDENRQRIIMKATGNRSSTSTVQMDKAYYNIESESSIDMIYGDMDENDVEDLITDIEEADKRAFGELTPYGQDSIIAIRIIANTEMLDDEDLVEMSEEKIQDNKIRNSVLKYVTLPNWDGGVHKAIPIIKGSLPHIIIAGMEFNVIVPQDPVLGLGNRDSLPYDTGMIFYTPPSNINRSSILFTMDNMQFPLDFICINDEGKRVVHIERDVQPFPYNLVELPLESIAVIEVKCWCS